jgi:hypothetical protein
MKKFYLFALLFGLMLFISTNSTYSQTSNDTTKVSAALSDTAKITGEIGKIYTKAEADSLFGPVLTVDTVKTTDLANLAKNTPKYMLFNLIDGKACVLNASREVIFNNSLVVGKAPTIEPTKVFRLFSTSKVLELIKQGGSDVTTIETKANVLTLTNGATVLEQSLPCPPHCDD